MKILPSKSNLTENVVELDVNRDVGSKLHYQSMDSRGGHPI